MLKDLKNYLPYELEHVTADLGGQKYLAKYIFSFIHEHNVNDIEKITPLNKTFREKLKTNGYYISHLKIIDKQDDSDGTSKYLFELPDGNRIETVLLTSETRRTLCISTQAGCAMNCLFCATGKIKFKRNLTAAEIVDQVNIINAETGQRISNVVYMGMGEPLDNYDAVIKAVRILNDPAGKNIGIRHQAVSTCGNADGIRRLAGETIQPRLAISLNAVSDNKRDKLMPINVKYPIAELLKAVKFYQSKTRNRVTFEYVLLDGINDSQADARQLANMLKGVMCNINLIEYNPHSGCDLKASNRQTIKKFQDALTQAGYETSIRFRMGRQIKAACGQLGAKPK